MKTHSILLAALTFGLATPVLAGPDLVPQFNAKSGTVRVTNVGDADAAASWVTVQCTAQGGGACPDPAPAAAAPYENPAFPNAASIAVPALGAGNEHAHVIAFFNDLVFAPGTYVFSVCADAGNAVAEDNERNNCVRVKKTVRKRLTGPDGLKSNTATN
jgi:hypothetical protein